MPSKRPEGNATARRFHLKVREPSASWIRHNYVRACRIANGRKGNEATYAEIRCHTVHACGTDERFNECRLEVVDWHVELLTDTAPVSALTIPRDSGSNFLNSDSVLPASQMILEDLAEYV